MVSALPRFVKSNHVGPAGIGARGNAFHSATPRRRGTEVRLSVLPLAFIALLAVQSAGAATYPMTIPFGRSWPYSIAVDSARGIAYFDASSGDYPPTGFLFGVLNVTTHSVAATLPLDVLPGPMALDQASGEVFVAGGESIEVFNGTNAVRMLDTSGHEILDIAIGGLSSDIFFTSGTGVFAMDPVTSALVESAALPKGPDSILPDPANGMIYVSEYLSGEIAVLNASTLALVTNVVLPSCCASHMALDPRTQTIYASTGSNLVDVVNAENDKFVRSIQVAPSAQNSTGPIAVDVATGRVYVGSSPGGSIVELDGSTGAVMGEFEVQSQVAGLAVDGASHELYVTNYHQITVFDIGASGSSFQPLIALAAAMCAVGVLSVYVLLKRRDERERVKVQPAGSGGQAGR